MKLPDASEIYNYHSGKVSEIVRQLAFAGVALVWIFKVDGENRVPEELFWPTLCMVAALLLDLLQYLCSTIAWGVFRRSTEKRLNSAGTPDEEFLAPRAINWPSNAFFYAKTIALGIGYWHLLQYLLDKMA